MNRNFFFNLLFLAVFCSPAEAQDNIYFDYNDPTKGVAAKIVLPGKPSDWVIDNKFADGDKSLTSGKPEIFVKATFQSSDGNIIGLLRTMEKIEPYDAGFVFDDFTTKAEGLERSSMSLDVIETGKLIKAEYLHPALNRIVAVVLLYNKSRAIELFINMPNDPKFKEPVASIVEYSSMTLDAAK